MVSVEELAQWAGLAKWGQLELQKLRDSARDMPCIRCWFHKGRHREAQCLCHYTGTFQQVLGKGKGTKVDDHVSAYLCAECHQEGDDPSVEWPEGDKDTLWFLYCFLTLSIALRRGILK